MVPTINRELEDYKELAFYDKLYPFIQIEELAKRGQTLPGSCSTQDTYTMTLVNYLGFTETAPLTISPIKWVTERPTDEDLWLSLIGIFASGDPNFAEHHDEPYR
jgi:hypothetical protein